MPHLFNYTVEELSAYVTALGESLSLAEARRVQAHVLAHGQKNYSLKKPIRKSLQKLLAEHFTLDSLKIVERIEDPIDKSTRYLFESYDGSLIEAVRIPLAKPNHYSVCLSSQVGCAMACDFCATGRLGFKRNLETWEILQQFLLIKAETQGTLSGAVFMGQGEPFHNYETVIRAAKILSAPTGCQVNSKNITISTVGLVPQIKRYTAEGHPFRLIVSLTSAIQEKRERLLPKASAWELAELADAVKAYASDRRERVTLAWVLMGGMNTDAAEVGALKTLFADTAFKLNLIDVNDVREAGYKRASEIERKNFVAMLQELQVPIVRRYSVGNASNSACGMLAAIRNGQ